MEKPQVTIAVQASGLKGPLGLPILIASVVLDHDETELVLLRATRGGLIERQRIALSNGPLRNYEINYATTELDAEFYTALAYYKGIQAEFEGLPG